MCLECLARGASHQGVGIDICLLGPSFSFFPGLPGVFLRRAYYRLTLDHCASNFYIGFGALFTHRRALVEKDAYIGAYALVGCAHLGEGCLIGSRVESPQRYRTARPGRAGSLGPLRSDAIATDQHR